MSVVGQRKEEEGREEEGREEECAGGAVGDPHMLLSPLFLA